jgi:hypothetical protein
MDGRWMRGDVLRVPQRQVGLMVWALDVAEVLTYIHPFAQVSSRQIYAKIVQTKQIPVHSRDAACPRPAGCADQRVWLSPAASQSH